MTFQIYAYQTSPGTDDVLYFAESYEACYSAAIKQRLEQRSAIGEDPVVASAIYKCLMRKPGPDIVIDVLNRPYDEHALFKACFLDRELVAVVTE